MAINVRSRSVFAQFLGLVLLAGCGPNPPTIIERRALTGHSREIVALAFAPDGKTLASRGADGVRVWDLASGKETMHDPSLTSDFGSIAFAPDGKTLAMSRPNAGAITWDIGGDGKKVMFDDPPGPPISKVDHSTYSWGLAYAPDGKILAGGGSLGGESGFLTLWDTKTGAASNFPPLKRPITTVSSSSDGKTIATGSADGILTLWDSTTLRQVREIAASRSYLAPVVLSPDGKIAASADDSRRVTFWDVATGRSLASMKGHLKAVMSLAFHPDGRTLVSGDSGGTVLAWDVASMQMKFRLPSDRGKIWALAFSPDGKTLASAGEDRLIHLWTDAEVDSGKH